MRYVLRAVAAFAAGAGVVLVTFGITHAQPLSGAIFTTTVDGDVVNGNVIYEQKEDVYLDGGPGPNAPASAAGLPEGDYYFQVTDPSGKDLLSEDHIFCRRIHVNEFGVIDEAYPGTNLEKVQGKWTEVPCQHVTGIDIDHSEVGAITVQLFPYDDTPNPGGVYKVWITPVNQYVGTLPDCVGQTGQCNVNGENWNAPNFHGFIPAHSKTDNYKVEKKGPPFVPPEITVRKFHDKNINGTQDEGEEDVTGWTVETTDPLGVVADLFTPILIVGATEGTYTFVEDEPEGTLQTVSTLDGFVVSAYPAADPTVQVVVLEESGETHEVVYGDVGVGSLTACKVFDRDGDGVADQDEPGVEGWKFELAGVDVLGAPVGPITGTTGTDGCTTFGDLLPGTYTVTELQPNVGDWIPTGPVSATEDIESILNGSDISGTVATATFTNTCTATADFGTKGYWHNKNGLQEITDEGIAYANSLDPYDSPTSYFGACDEPFDGLCEGGVPVDAAYNQDDGTLIWGAGTSRAEISHFLVDANAGGDPREQLAQQLLAFIFNTLYRLGDVDAAIIINGEFVTAQAIIDAAIAAWQGGDAAAQNEMQELLNALNNNDAVAYVPTVPCAFSYD